MSGKFKKSQDQGIFREFCDVLGENEILQKYQANVRELETGGCGFNPRRGRQHSFVEIDHEILSTVILSLPLIQEGQLSNKLMKLGCFGPDVSFFAKFIKISASVLSGKFEFVSGKCQGILVSPKCMNSEGGIFGENFGIIFLILS